MQNKEHGVSATNTESDTQIELIWSKVKLCPYHFLAKASIVLKFSFSHS